MEPETLLAGDHLKPGEITNLDGMIALCIARASGTLGKYLRGGEIVEVHDHHICPNCRCTNGRENLGRGHWFCWACEGEGDEDESQQG